MATSLMRGHSPQDPGGVSTTEDKPQQPHPHTGTHSPRASLFLPAAQGETRP